MCIKLSREVMVQNLKQFIDEKKKSETRNRDHNDKETNASRRRTNRTNNVDYQISMFHKKNFRQMQIFDVIKL